MPSLPAYLPFEGELEKIDAQIHKLLDLSATNAMDLTEELARSRAQREECLHRIYGKLAPWDRIQVARHQQRPQTWDYLDRICDEFLEIHGDRFYGDDRALVSGFAKLGDHRVVLLGQHKGRNIQERTQCNFGSPQPEGYRKALWKMRLAEKYHLPLVCLIDTKGAAPDIGAEERGQSQAIAYNLMVLSGLKTPIVCVVIGEGGSGGALGIGVGDRFLIQEYAYFSVISPEGCASILWKDSAKKADAAAALKMTAPDLKGLGVVDEIVPEPLGGAHRDPDGAARLLKACLVRNLDELKRRPLSELLDGRYRKLRALGQYREAVTA